MDDLRGGPVPRLMHIGPGNFFRAHQVAFTDDAPDGPWQWAAFSGRSGRRVDDLGGRGRYHLLVRGPDGDAVTERTSITALHHGDDRVAFDGRMAAPSTTAVTLTITEAGYRATASGGADFDDPALAGDLVVLSAESAAGRSGTTSNRLQTAPGRLLSGLAERRRVDAGPIALVPCDNLSSNAAVLRRVLTDLAERVDAEAPRCSDGGLTGWLERSVTVVGTVVDRITPRPTAADVALVSALTGEVDPVTVVTEGFREWILDGVVGGGPDWAAAGAVIVADLTPFEHRKLRLLNGAHSILAYTGPVRGHATVAEAIADDRCRRLVEGWWDLCQTSLVAVGASTESLTRYRVDLLERFANPRLPHLLAQIAADGSEKLRIRILPVLRAERSAGRLPEAPVAVIAAWVASVRDAASSNGALADARADALLGAAADGDSGGLVTRVLRILDGDLAEDSELVGAITDLLGG